MNRRGPLVVGAIVLVAVLAWYFLLFSPKGKDLSDTKHKLVAAQTSEQDLRTTLERLEALRKSSAANAQTLQVLTQLVPEKAELAKFIDEANAIAQQSGIDWLSISPTPPATNPAGGPSVIALSMQVEGAFHDLLSYLNALQDPDSMPRLVIVDTINIAAQSGSVTFAGESPKLTVTLSARMFTQAAPTGAAATGGTTGGTTATTSSSATTSPSGSTPSTISTPTTSAPTGAGGSNTSAGNS